MAFDPNKYLAEKASVGGFDPRRYLAEKTGNTSLDSTMSAPGNEALIAEVERFKDPMQRFKASHPVKYAIGSALRPGLEFAGFGLGAAAGGTGGSLVPGPGTLTGGVLGAGLGYAGGSELSRNIESGLGFPDRNLPYGQLAPNALKKVAEGAGMEMLGGIGGKVIASSLNKLAAPFRSSITPQAEAIREKAKDIGVELSPSETTGSMIQSGAEATLSRIPFSAGVMRKQKMEQVKALLAERDRLVNSSGPPETLQAIGTQIQDEISAMIKGQESVQGKTLEQARDSILKRLGSNETYASLGQKAKESVSTAQSSAEQQASKLFEQRNSLIDPESKVATENLSKSAEGFFQQESRGKLQDKRLMSVLEQLGPQKDKKTQELIDNLIEAGVNPESVEGGIKAAKTIPEMSFGDLTATRTRIGRLIEKADSSGNAQEAGIYRQLYKAIDDDVAAFANKQGGEIGSLDRQARDLYKKNLETFDTKTIGRLSKTDPDRVVDMLVVPGNLQPLRDFKKAAGSQSFEPIKRKFTSKIFGMDSELPFNPATTERTMARYGREVLSEVYTPSELAQIDRVIKFTKGVGEAPIGSPIFNQIIRQSPETVVPGLLQKENTVRITQVMNALSPAARGKLKQGAMSYIMRDNKTGDFSLAQLNQNLVRHEAPLSKVFGSKELEEINRLNDIGLRAKRAAELSANPSETAKGVIAYDTFKDMFKLVFSKPTGIIKAPVYLTPYAMARLYTSPIGRRYLTDGFKIPAATKEGSELAIKMSLFMNREQDNFDKSP